MNKSHTVMNKSHTVMNKTNNINVINKKSKMGKVSNVYVKVSNVSIKGSNVGVSRQEESRRLYEAYRGRKIESYGRTGTVVGWSDYPDIIVAKIDDWRGWDKDLATSGIYSDQELPDDGKYWYVLKRNVI